MTEKHKAALAAYAAQHGLTVADARDRLVAASLDALERSAKAGRKGWAAMTVAAKRERARKAAQARWGRKD